MTRSSGHNLAEPQRQFQAVIFDMDGTLVEATLDFAAVRAELRIGEEADIIETIQAMPAEPARKAMARLTELEMDGARRATLSDGAAEAMAAVQSAGIKTALLTRNNRQAMRTVIQRFDMTFDLTWSRESGIVKPSPKALLRACSLLGVHPERTACVGDYLYDVQAANAAGAVSVLLVRPGQTCAFAAEARCVIHSLRELPAVLGI